jgi:hypothetical protein
MPKFRDADTGEYISEEDALSRDPSTWVAEDDSSQHHADLREIYKKCEAHAITPLNSHVLNATASLPLYVLRRILNDYGANIKETE